MQNILLTLFLAVAFATRAVVKADGLDGPTDKEIQLLSLTTNVKIPYRLADPNDPYQVGWKFPDPAKIDHPVETGKDFNSSISVKIDLSRCAGGDYRYGVYVMPYDRHSTNQVVPTVRFRAQSDNKALFAYTEATIENGFNGRFLLADQAGKVQRTGLMGLRVMVSPGYAVMWLQADPDEETGDRALNVASVSFYYFGDSEAGDRERIYPEHIDSHRGKVHMKTTNNTVDNSITLQYC